MYSNSLVLVMATIWLSSWFAQSVTGWSAYNSDQLVHGEQALTYWQFLGTARFWEATLQNWQSEFLAVGSMAVLAIYLRQRGSPESKARRRTALGHGNRGLTRRTIVTVADVRWLQLLFLPPLRPAAAFCAFVPPWLEALRFLPLPDALPPLLEASGEFAIRAARHLLIPFLRSPSYCLSSFTLEPWSFAMLILSEVAEARPAIPAPRGP